MCTPPPSLPPSLISFPAVPTNTRWSSTTSLSLGATGSPRGNGTLKHEARRPQTQQKATDNEKEAEDEDEDEEDEGDQGKDYEISKKYNLDSYDEEGGGAETFCFSWTIATHKANNGAWSVQACLVSLKT